MSQQFKDILLPLAVACGALEQVYAISYKGKFNENLFNDLLQTVFKMQVDSPYELYKADNLLSVSLKSLHNVFSFENEHSFTIIKNLFSLINLEIRLGSDKSALSRLAYKINLLSSKASTSPDAELSELAHDFADIYTSVISPLGPKIIILGKASFLNSTTNSSKIRALLLASVRSLAYWDQLGGSRFDFFFRRKKMLILSQEMINRF